jgi:hypothetical protein
MKTILATILSAALAGAAFAQVPSLINYQGRLTDANGDPVTGSKNFSISIFDSATGGTLLYTETIGAVTLDDNGVYGFQFGANGTSNKQATETIGTTSGSTLTYTKTLSNTQVVENSITVTDGTNSWSQSVGNPGVGATATLTTVSGFVVGATITNGGSGYTSAPPVTIAGNGSGATATATLTGGVVSGIVINSAGSGYTGTPTVSIDQPVIPFLVDYSSGSITATYATAPTVGRSITATYSYTDGAISGALVTQINESGRWLSVTIDNQEQETRERILTVPYAVYADTSGTSVDPLARSGINDLTAALLRGPVVSSTITSSVLAVNNIIGYVGEATGSGNDVKYIDFSDIPRKISFLGANAAKSSLATMDGGFVKFYYQDGTSNQINFTSDYLPDSSEGAKIIKNPHPDKLVSRISGYFHYFYSYVGTRNNINFKAYHVEPSELKFSLKSTGSSFYIEPNCSSSLKNTSAELYFDDGTKQMASWNQWLYLQDSKNLESVRIRGSIDELQPVLGVSIPSIKVLSN